MIDKFKRRMIIKMMDDIIRKFGFEDIHTIIFCGLCESGVGMDTLWDTYDEYMNLDVMLDE